ncbi:DUF190 domain-containing protein [Halanaerobium salsuginis]|jgi:hypothetical protein|uniref:Uncharacterized protein n=1 Tax=Halanaerobium salsuginis TaxID=29563 RepID=A0A1I4M6Z3_9FIRM|nr:DUF190 domain-containing protein [Halanaerobium salsuginis]SFL99021.1 hypothetical protein SAMN02983006_02524 [Halanaerobium salsuginis]
MEYSGNGKILKIYIGETDKWKHEPLYHALIKKFKEKGMAGATVIQGIEGFGLNSRIKTAHILQLSEDLPLVIEVVDQAEKIEKILPEIKEMVTEGLVTIEDVRVISYTANNKEKQDKN